MIQASELRIGNWVIWAEDGTYMRMGPTSFLLPDKSFSAISLTPEMLDACGFTEIAYPDPDNPKETAYANWEMQSGFCLTSVGIASLVYYGEMYIKHLHQLQNLYFAFTGQELTVNLTSNQSA